MNHRIRVVGILRQNNEILLVEQEKPRTGDRIWGMPGGGLEPTDEDIYRGVEREVFEETGVRVRAGQIRFVSEYTNTRMMQVTIWIECHPFEGDMFTEPTMAYVREDDYIRDLGWWSRDAFPPHYLRSSALKKDEFWDGLDLPEGVVTYLGKTRDI
ncbi:MAG: NUDIX hydrolase [Saprospiraceae bacterium]|nr:NUDIX hydrolase [Saprospiraceae bacterium]